MSVKGLQKHLYNDALHNTVKVLNVLGIELNDQNFKDTPKRWLNYLLGYMQPYHPGDDLGKSFDEPVDDLYDHSMIVQVNIPYRAVCAHHLLPVLGTAQVGYIPNKKVVGISKLSRLVYGITHASPSLQEDVCNRITKALEEHLECVGAMCCIDAIHGCMSARGIEERDTVTITSSTRGAFRDNADARYEFLNLARRNS